MPQQVYSDISMDFVEGLPKVPGKSVLMAVVDRLSIGSSIVATTFIVFTEVFRLYELPESIVLDRDKVFLGFFAFSSACHP